jgi:phenylacetate-CoA ligase
VNLSDALAQRLKTLAISERRTQEEIEAAQRRSLAALAQHCMAHSAHFRARLAKAGLQPGDFAAPGAIERLPPLSRRELQSGQEIFCTAVPKPCMPLYETRTSGSTGEPVIVWRTAFNQLDWLATTMREHLWHTRDFLKPFCAIRANIPNEISLNNWGLPAALLRKTGPLLGLPITTSIERQAERIGEFNTHTLLVYPSDLGGILRHCQENRISFPALKEIITVGETLAPHIRADAESTFGAKVSDMYSSQEAGNIALQCPASGLYHVMAENLIVEVVDAQDESVTEGATGRILITDLRNFATPLIRYDIGDYAEMGPQCPCGRGLPTLRRVLGRERNLIRMPDGSRHFPLVGFREFREIAPIIQYQAVQHDRENIELRLVVARALTSDEENRLTAHVQAALGHPFNLKLVYFAHRIPTGANGKFEEFVSRAD